MNLADKDNKHRLTDGNSATLPRLLQFMLNASNQCAYAKCFRARSERVRYAKSNYAHILWVPYTDFISTKCCYPIMLMRNQDAQLLIYIAFELRHHMSPSWSAAP